MSITALVINFNAGPALQRCVQSLVDSTIQPQIVVVDNASTDGSAEHLRDLYGDFPDIEILFNPANLGFARAVNAAVTQLGSDQVLVINPDCVIHREALALMQQALVADARAALAAPLVRNNDGKVERAALRRFPDPWNSLMTMTGLWRLGHWIPALRGVPVNTGELPGGVVRAEAVSGACMLIRVDAMLEVGLMDEAYGLHCEDLDLMYRLQQAGWHCLLVPAAASVHTQGVSSKSRPIWVHTQKHKSMARFFRKFQASDHWLPMRWLVYTGIWLRYLLLWPLVWIRK